MFPFKYFYPRRGLLIDKGPNLFSTTSVKYGHPTLEQLTSESPWDADAVRLKSACGPKIYNYICTILKICQSKKGWASSATKVFVVRTHKLCLKIIFSFKIDCYGYIKVAVMGSFVHEGKSVASLHHSLLNATLHT